MIQKSKTDPVLGKAVHEHLVKIGIETPMTDQASLLTDDEKIQLIMPHVAGILQTLGLDLSDDSLNETPNRVAKMYVNETMYGLNYSNFPKCTTVENKMCVADEFVLEQNVKLQSLCEHHLVPILGKNSDHGGVVVAYVPKNRVLGISKINRITDFYARRPQIQERFTHQVMEALKFVLGTDDVAVYVDAQHLCVSTRGVGDVGSSTVTCATGGVFNSNANTRSEFLSIARGNFIK